MNIIIGGALGRMGRELARAAGEAGIGVACGVDIAYAGQAMDFPMVASYAAIPVRGDVLVDFSRADGLAALLTYATQAGMPSVLCTTGYTQPEVEAITQASAQIAVFRSANMSLGINVLQRLCAVAAKALGDRFDVEIVEKHHRQKLDSPSGTALMLYDSICGALGGQHPAVYGRSGRAAARGAGEVGIHAVRGGTVTGEHEVGFYGNAEQIILTHRAENRALFAEGAVRAAQFLAGKPAGLYSMQDVVAEVLGG